jgi:hypothetical protein
MQPNPPFNDHPTADEPHLPSLSLPPNPFGAGARPTATAIHHGAAPTGTSIEDLIGALAEPLAPAADTERPLHEFSVAVERRARRERRTKPRVTPDRRAFASEHMAAPHAGPVDDPRPMTPPPAHDGAARPAPIDATMPPLPIAEAPAHLEPARPYELPTRGVATTTHRTTRPATIASTPFPQRLDDPPAPMGAPAPPSAPAPAPAQPAPAGTTGIDAIFGTASIPTPVGHLQPALTIPDAGPAGPAMAPAAGLAAPVAAAAAAPNAWYGDAVQVDDEMLVWNAPVAAPSMAMAMPPAPQGAPAMPASAPAASAPLTVGPLAPPAPARSSGSPLRLALLVAIPAVLGVAIAFAVNQFLL